MNAITFEGASSELRLPASQPALANRVARFVPGVRAEQSEWDG